MANYNEKTKEQFTNFCTECEEPFTDNKPCCCDLGFQEVNGVTLHFTGYCEMCCKDKD